MRERGGMSCTKCGDLYPGFAVWVLAVRQGIISLGNDALGFTVALRVCSKSRREGRKHPVGVGGFFARKGGYRRTSARG